MEVFILRMTPYREKDYIITSISNEGLVTFKAVGLSRLNAKLAGTVTLYSLIDVELEEKKTGLVLVNAVPISKNYKIISDYLRLSVLNFIGEVTLRLLHDESEISQAYPFIKKAVLTLEQTFSPATLAYIVLAKVLIAAGYGLEVNRCVYCQTRQDIVGINYYNGGFVCRKDIGHEHDDRLSVDQLNIVRFSFLVPEEQMIKTEFSNNSLIPLFESLVNYYEEHASLKLKSFPLLLQSLKQQHS